MTPSLIHRSLLVCALTFSLLREAQANTYTVTNANDGGAGSLRTAIDQANGHVGADTVAFNIAGAGPHVITLQSQLPDLTDGFTTVDGTTQPGYAGTPRVVLSGLALPTDVISSYRPGGLIVRGNDCVITGLCLIGFKPQPGQPNALALNGGWWDSSCAVRLHGARGVVSQCHFSCSPDGMSLLFNGVPANNSVDVLVIGNFNVVENSLGLNLEVGHAGEASNNVVRSNILGFRRDSTPFPTGEVSAITGIHLDRFGSAMVYGGLNRLGVLGGGNRAQVLYLYGADSTMQANTVGRIFASGFSNTVGGAAVGLGNIVDRGLVAGEAGIEVSGGTTVEGNEVRNADYGIRVSMNSHPRLLSNTLRNCRQGIVVQGGYTYVSQNYQPTSAFCAGNIFPGTLFYPINLGDPRFGREPNDPLDADLGDNDLQNFPTLDSIICNPGTNQTEVRGTLNSRASRLYRIELYSSVQVPGREPVGEVTRGNVTITTNAAGVGTFQFNLPGLYPGMVFSAIASDMTANTGFGFLPGQTSAMSPGLAPPVGRFTLLPAVASVSETGTSATLRVLRSAGSCGPASVRLAVNGSTAASDDLRFLYSGISAVPPTLNFADGETEQTITLFAFNDTLNEALETFTLSLTAPTNGATLAPNTTIVVVGDNDPLPSFSVNDITVNEDVGTANFTVTLSAPSGQETRVEVGTAAGTAWSPVDYTAAGSTMIFAPGETSKSASIHIVDGITQENQEYFHLWLISPVNATVADPVGICTINDLDGPPASTMHFLWQNGDLFLDEGGFGGQATFTVTRLGSLVGAASVRVSTVFESASAADVTPLNNQLVSFADGQQFQTVTVTLTEDSLDEGDEIFYLVLSDPVGTGGATVTPLDIQVTLTDNDAPPTLTGGSPNVIEGDVGLTLVAIPLTLSAPTGRAFTVELQVTGGTADAADYSHAVTATIPAGATGGTLEFYVRGDFVGEPDETIVYSLNTSLGHPTVGGTIKILNDDALVPTFRLEGVPATVPEDVGIFSVILRRTGVLTGTDTCNVITIPTTSSAQVLSSNFTFGPGEETAVVKISVRDDFTDEPDELATLLLQPTAPAVAVALGTYDFTILDNDDPPSISLDGPVSIVEKDATSVTVLVNLNLSAPSAFSVKAQNLATTGGTASGTADYQPLNVFSYTFPAGDVTATFPLTIYGDYLDEADETILVTLGSALNATLGVASQTITIIDNDTPQRPYRDWLAGHFNAAERRTALADPCADPDGDHLSNGLEFFLNSNPRNANSGPEKFFLTQGPTAMVWSFGGIRSRVPMTNLRIMQSKDLLTWLAIDGAYLTLTDTDPDARQYKVSVPYAPTPRLFLRVESDCVPFEPEP